MVRRLDKIGFGELSIWQEDSEFCYGVDAVILADFASKKIKGVNSIDLGSGSGVIPIILSWKTNLEKLYGVEIQDNQYNLFQKNIEHNGLENRVFAHKCNVNQLKYLEEGFKSNFDIVTSNPPYTEKNKGILGENISVNIARHELEASLDEFVKTASWLLRDKGLFYMVNRPSRIADMISSMRKHNIEPKEIKFISPHKGEDPNIVLIEGKKNSGRDLKITFEYVREGDGSYSQYINKAYERIDE